MIGVGTQDSKALAFDFVKRHKLVAQQMYWDEGGDSWRYWGVPGQPAGILVSASGQVVKAWTGITDFAAVTRYLDGVAPKPSANPSAKPVAKSA